MWPIDVRLCKLFNSVVIANDRFGTHFKENLTSWYFVKENNVVSLILCEQLVFGGKTINTPICR